MKTEKPYVESKTEENNKKCCPKDFINQNMKAHDFKKKGKSVTQIVSFKNQNENFQNKKEKAKQFDLLNEISRKKSQNKAYWKQ